MDSSLMNKKVKLYIQEGRVAAVSRIAKHRLEIFTRSDIKKKCKKSRFRTFGVHWTPEDICILDSTMSPFSDISNAPLGVLIVLE